MGRLKTIVWDVDDVLNDLMGSWFFLGCQDHPECAVTYEDLKEKPPQGSRGHHRLLLTVSRCVSAFTFIREDGAPKGSHRLVSTKRRSISAHGLDCGPVTGSFLLGAMGAQ